MARKISKSKHPMLQQLQGLKVSFSMIILFRKELMKHWPQLTIAVLCALGYTAMRLAEPWPLKFVFDNVLVNEPLVTPWSWLNTWLGDDRMRVLALATVSVLALALLRGVFYYFQNVLTTQVGQDVVIKIRQRLFAHVQALSIRFHNESSTGDLLMRFTGDINNLRQLLAASLLSLISESIILVSFITVMFILNWQLAILAIITAPTIMFLLMFYSGKIRSAARKQRRREGELASRLHESLSNMQVVQIFTREEEEETRLKKLNSRSLRQGMKTTRLEGRLNQGIEIAVSIGMALTIWVGATQVIDGRLSPGELVVFVNYMQSFYRPMRRLSRVAERASKASSCVDRITEVLDQESDIEDGDVDAGRLKGSIRFDNVSFNHSDGATILKDINLDIPAGKSLALVGPSGAGKSTLVTLLPRLFDSSHGTVTIDGRDIREYTLKSLRDNISVVPQDGALFSGTIGENILYGREGATEEEMIAAAKEAQIHDHIMTLPDGYDTVVRERGTSLSGGQRQRIAIARALVRDASIVILDEPTTGLDAQSETAVVEALQRLLDGRTAILITHRLSTTRQADSIAVIDSGEIVEEGSHEDLMAARGQYYELDRMQSNVEPIAGNTDNISEFKVTGARA